MESGVKNKVDWCYCVCALLFRVDPTFRHRLHQYLEGEVVADVHSMASPKPQLTHLKQLVFPDIIENVHR